MEQRCCNLLLFRKSDSLLRPWRDKRAPMSDDQRSMAPDPTTVEETSLNSHAYGAVSDEGASEEQHFTDDLPHTTSDAEVVTQLGELRVSVGALAAAIAGLRTDFSTFQERSAAQEGLIARMQQRIEELQGDQVRALLSPVYQELASLHADLIEAAGRDYSALPPERLPRELSFLLSRVDTTLHFLGLESVGAATGVPFDPRLHSAVRRVPTGRKSLDGVIATVQRQGFTVPGAAKASMYARVTVYAYDSTIDEDTMDQPAPMPDVQNT
jgi:molecular chaperone GrpE (heat shock protein)